MGLLARSSALALRYAAVWYSLMLFRFLSSALGCACGCLHVTGQVSAVIAPHTFTYEVWLPDVLHQWTDTIDICDVWTLYAVLDGMTLYPRSRVLRQLSTTPNVAMSAGWEPRMCSSPLRSSDDPRSCFPETLITCVI